MRMQSVLPILFLLLASCSEAQSREARYQKVLPGSAALDPARIRPHEVRYEKPGFMNYVLERVERGGREVYRLSVYFNSLDGPPDTMFFDPETLGYLGRRLVTKDHTVDVSFSDDHFTGELTPTADSKYTAATYDKRYPHGGFEPAVMNYWITALPLEAGYTASIPVFDLSQSSSMSWADIEVLKREKLEIDGETYDTWKVQSTNGKRKKTIWVSTTEPYAIKMITKGGFGAWTLKR